MIRNRLRSWLSPQPVAVLVVLGGVVTSAGTGGDATTLLSPEDHWSPLAIHQPAPPLTSSNSSELRTQIEEQRILFRNAEQAVADTEELQRVRQAEFDEIISRYTEEQPYSVTEISPVQTPMGISYIQMEWSNYSNDAGEGVAESIATEIKASAALTVTDRLESVHRAIGRLPVRMNNITTIPDSTVGSVSSGNNSRADSTSSLLARSFTSNLMTIAERTAFRARAVYDKSTDMDWVDGWLDGVRGNLHWGLKFGTWPTQPTEENPLPASYYHVFTDGFLNSGYTALALDILRRNALSTLIVHVLGSHLDDALHGGLGIPETIGEINDRARRAIQGEGDRWFTLGSWAIDVLMEDALRNYSALNTSNRGNIYPMPIDSFYTSTAIEGLKQAIAGYIGAVVADTIAEVLLTEARSRNADNLSRDRSVMYVELDALRFARDQLDKADQALTEAQRDLVIEQLQLDILRNQLNQGNY